MLVFAALCVKANHLIHYLYLPSGAKGGHTPYTLFFLSVLPLRIELMQLCWQGSKTPEYSQMSPFYIL